MIPPNPAPYPTSSLQGISADISTPSIAPQDDDKDDEGDAEDWKMNPNIVNAGEMGTLSRVSSWLNQEIRHTKESIDNLNGRIVQAALHQGVTSGLGGGPEFRNLAAQLTSIRATDRVRLKSLKQSRKYMSVGPSGST